MTNITEDEKLNERVNRKARRKRLTHRLETLRERLGLLELELDEYTNDFFRVCIFGSARLKPDDHVYKLTEQLGHALGRKGIDVLTGGGPGLMEAANKGTLAGKAEAGTKSKSFGITIALNEFEQPSEHLEIKHHHKRFSSRLDDFMRLSHAIIIVQGGIGTLLELFFSWQLLQVGHMRERPIILVDRGFWSGLLQWMKDKQITRGLISGGEMRWIHMVDTVEEAMQLIEVEHEKFREMKIARGEV